MRDNEKHALALALSAEVLSLETRLKTNSKVFSQAISMRAPMNHHTLDFFLIHDHPVFDGGVDGRVCSAVDRDARACANEGVCDAKADTPTAACH